MKKKITKTTAILLAALLVLGMLAGCGPANNSNNVPANNSNSAEPSGNNVDPGSNTVDPPKDETVFVSSVEELINAIKPNAKIVIKAGTYDIGEALKKIWDTEGERFRVDHEYLDIDISNDGYALEVFAADGLSISGETGKYGDTELLNSYSQSSVLGFSNCDGLELKGLTMGHTKKSDCTGDVLVIINSKDAVFDSLDLYGCGVYAMRFEAELGNTTIRNSVLRDCSNGAFYDNGFSGNIVFEDCVLTGSDGIPYFELSLDSTMVFKRCTIGVNESNYLSFCDYVVLEHCIVAEPSVYPDYFSPLGLFIPDMLTTALPDPAALTGEGKWLVYTMADKDANIPGGEYTPYLDMKDGSPLRTYLAFAADGTGTINSYKDKPVKFTWTQNEYDFHVKTESGEEGSLECFTITDMNSGEFDRWMRLSLGEYVYWMCLREGL